jgi:hypothetical protein
MERSRFRALVLSLESPVSMRHARMVAVADQFDNKAGNRQDILIWLFG